MSPPELTISDRTGYLNQPQTFLDSIDRELAVIWAATRRFCGLVNRAAKSKHKLSERTLLQAMTSIMYRLLHKSSAAHSCDETIRLALLAFCAQSFLQLPNLQIQDTFLPGAYRECLVSGLIPENGSPQLLLWLQMVGAVTVFGTADHAWLKPLLQSSCEKCGVDSWSELADVMNSFIWIGLVFDKPGQAIFSSLISSQSEHAE
jgi:hypothetical protein